MCDPRLVTLLKFQAHNNQSTRENATPSNGQISIILKLGNRRGLSSWKSESHTVYPCHAHAPLTLFQQGGALDLLTSPPWITSKRLSYDLQTSDFSLNSSVDIFESSWRVHHHWRYHGNRVLTAMFVKMFTYHKKTRRLGLFLLLLTGLWYHT